MTHRVTQPAGVLMTDGLLALGLLVLMMMLLTVMIGSQHEVGQDLADRRQLYRHAETAMLRLQHGEPFKKRAGIQRQVQVLKKPQPDGWRWVRVTLRQSDPAEEASLYGLVRLESLRERNIEP
jgi:hypothetical protein